MKDEVYKKKQETAKKEYLKALSAYRAGNLQSSEGGETTLINQTPIAVAVTTQSIQNFTPQVQTMTAPTFPQQNFVSQPIINQAVIQQLPAQQQQQAPINQFENNQQISQQQQVYQQPQQQQQQPLQSITNNNNQMPPVATQPAHQNYEKCIRNGCLNPAIVSVDWEDEYCSNECVIQHCREVFGNFIQMNSSNQQINFPVK
ncbi:hypothetical protein PVAND_011896 [Polypedilum vanderplanki]|uniref:Uncharacterized protein n=1 Tax=Polypedilum vanderplanki TaxID=319348 RepID=A0A9J6CLR9_POLVA|nr:hypothetical protein PVAND_011896 [Polypedilum vanderplanki]